MASQFTGLQLAFIDAYVGEANFNKTEAARIAGYAGNGNTLAQIGFKLVKNGKIANEIQARLEERAMSSSELLMRWGDQARIDVSEYYNTEGGFDIKKFTKDGHGHLIKTVKPGKYGTTVEFHDKIASQRMIAQNIGMLVEKSEVIEINAGSLVDFEDWKKSQSDRQSEAQETLEQFDE